MNKQIKIMKLMMDNNKNNNIFKNIKIELLI